MKKKIILIAIGIFTMTSSYSQVFSDLPFNIKIGETGHEEIENHGVCEKRIKVSAYSFRCEEYEIAGKFRVFMSQNEVVNKIQFSNYHNHRLPRKWSELGLSLGSGYQGSDGLFTQTTNGTQKEEVLRILKLQGISGIREIKSSDYKDILFELGNYEYQFRVHYGKGLWSINISEFY
jgi:hypothetical protein